MPIIPATQEVNNGGSRVQGHPCLHSEFDVSLIFRRLSQKTKSKLTKSYSPTLGIITFSAVALRSDLKTLAVTIQLCHVTEQHLWQHERPAAMVNSVVTAWVTKPAMVNSHGNSVSYKTRKRGHLLLACHFQESRQSQNFFSSIEISHILTPHRNSSKA